MTANASPLCDDADALAPWLAAILCPHVASLPASADSPGPLEGVFPILGGTVGKIVLAAAVALGCGLVLRHVGRSIAGRHR